ncbi:hypothetical protein SO802_023593 [Lithocarpus litseifolius]|uniref:RNase H type-1 domain-containing protein n=1 Tax=Lithocarpus litseifolius TaxID=425828 RepID=A0AAW2C6M8_9ROSI
MQATKFLHCVNYPRNSRRLVIKQVRWERPGEGWLKLNMDGAVNDTLNSAGAGGVLRDDKGNRVMNLNAFIIELDAKALVDALNNPSYANSVMFPLVDDCRHLASKIPRLCIRHIYPEANKCADRLAKLGLQQSLDFVIHSSLPVDIIASFEADCQGMFVNRLCPDSCISV